MELKEIMQKQKDFDQQHAGNIDFFAEITDDNITELEHLLVCLLGEVGELANITKKIVRGDFSLTQSKNAITEEIVDSFIYLIKLCTQLNIDLEKEYLKKMDKNREKFKRYEK